MRALKSEGVLLAPEQEGRLHAAYPGTRKEGGSLVTPGGLEVQYAKRRARVEAQCEARCDKDKKRSRISIRRKCSTMAKAQLMEMLLQTTDRVCERELD